MLTTSPSQLREQAVKAQAEAENQYRTSEYPRLGRSSHLRVAEELEDYATLLDDLGDSPVVDLADSQTKKAARVYWLKIRAAKKALESAQLAAQSHDMGSRRPFGQPLVGSPARMRTQRNAINKLVAVSDRAHEAYEESKRLERKAAAAERNTAIYSDDSQAIDKIKTKITLLDNELTALRALRKKHGKSAKPILNYRQESFIIPNMYHADQTYVLEQKEMTKSEYKKATHWSDSGGTKIPVGAQHRIRVYLSILPGASCAVFLTDSKVHPKPENEQPATAEAPSNYQITRLGAEVARLKKRLVELEHRAEVQAAPPKATVMIGDIEVVDNVERMKIELWFPGKPSVEVRTMIKSYGFRWIRSGGCWSRNRGMNAQIVLDKLREQVAV